jgi:hypothetical protein
MIAAPLHEPSLSRAERGAHLRGLHLQGATAYACRTCRNGVRVVSAWYLPAACPACGASTWSDGRCACSARRRPGTHGRAFCHQCGDGIWLRVGPRARS